MAHFEVNAVGMWSDDGSKWFRNHAPDQVQIDWTNRKIAQMPCFTNWTNWLKNCIMVVVL
jgi:hypothetical protein